MYVLQKGIATHAMVQPAPNKYRRDRRKYRDKKVMRHLHCPEPGDPIAEHADRACRQEVALQRGAKVLGRPSPHRSIDHKRRSVDAVGSAQNTGCEAAAQQPWMAIMLQVRRPFAQQEKTREEND